MKKIVITVLAIGNILAILYLILPTPNIPDLPNSIKSTEEGDTVQLPRVNGYFTNQNRQQVMAFYYKVFKSPLVIRLNHPPEKAKQIFKDTMQTYYLEELVIPFKESLFVNGYEWQNDVFTPPDKRIAYKLLVGKTVYNAKITTRVFTTTIPQRFIAFFISEFSLIFLLYVIYDGFFKRIKK